LHEWLTEHQSCDVLYAARKLQVSVTAHAIVLARASAAIERIDTRLDAAQEQEQGLLKQFNREYKRRRALAREHGQDFIIYRHAWARLRKLLAATAPTGRVPENLFGQVFGET
jgi:hypothetical protein